MAQAMGMGIMPWSPLKHGFLSGKFRRDNGSVDRNGRAGHPEKKICLACVPSHSGTSRTICSFARGGGRSAIMANF
jgi:aryl-alcohol dehydrogenase-like predicted oxidoreductase